MAKPKTDVSAWLRNETPQHLDLLSRLRETITASLTARTELDADGKSRVIPADLNELGTPTRDWCRAYAQYRGGYEMLLSEERERAKLLIMANARGQAQLTDEEYESEIRKLGIEAVKELDAAELAGEIQRRGLTAEQLIAPDDLD